MWLKSLLSALFFVSALLSCGSPADASIPGAGAWSISVDDNGKVDIAKGDEVLFCSVGCSFVAEGRHIDISDYSCHKLRSENIADGFGSGSSIWYCTVGAISKNSSDDIFFV